MVKFLVFYDSYYRELDIDPEGFKIWEFQLIILERLHISLNKFICLLHDRGVLGRDIPFDQPMYKLCYSPMVYLIVEHFPNIGVTKPFEETRKLFLDFLAEDEEAEHICDDCLQSRQRGRHYSSRSEETESISHSRSRNRNKKSKKKHRKEPDRRRQKKESVPELESDSASQEVNQIIHSLRNNSNVADSSNNVSASASSSLEEVNTLRNRYQDALQSGITQSEHRRRQEQRNRRDQNQHQSPEYQPQQQHYQSPMGSLLSTLLGGSSLGGSSLGNGSTFQTLSFELYPGGSSTSSTDPNVYRSMMNLMTSFYGSSLGGTSHVHTFDHFLDLLNNLEDVPVTLTQEGVNKLPVFKFTELKDKMDQLPDDQQNTCRVCLEEFKDEDDIRMLFCKHIFHKDCVDQWLTEHNVTCPLCRQDTRENDVDNKSDNKSENEATNDTEKSLETEDEIDNNAVEEKINEDKVVEEKKRKKKKIEMKVKKEDK